MKIDQIIDDRKSIAHLAIEQDKRYVWEPIGDEDGDVNEAGELLGMTRVHYARTTDDVAVYADTERTEWAIVADANGPIVIRPIQVNAWLSIKITHPTKYGTAQKDHQKPVQVLS